MWIENKKSAGCRLYREREREREIKLEEGLTPGNAFLL